jgi:hypothetical protein
LVLGWGVNGIPENECHVSIAALENVILARVEVVASIGGAFSAAYATVENRAGTSCADLILQVADGNGFVFISHWVVKNVRIAL